MSSFSSDCKHFFRVSLGLIPSVEHSLSVLPIGLCMSALEIISLERNCAYVAFELE